MQRFKYPKFGYFNLQPVTIWILLSKIFFQRRPYVESFAVHILNLIKLTLTYFPKLTIQRQFQERLLHNKVVITSCKKLQMYVSVYKQQFFYFLDFCAII